MTALLHPRNVNMKITYRDDENAFLCQTHFSSGILHFFPPPMTLSISRRLFLQSQTEGALTVYAGPDPTLSISLISPTPFESSSGQYDPSPTDEPYPYMRKPGSLSGLLSGAIFKSYSLVLAGIGTGLKAEWGITLSEIALQFKLGLEYGFFTGFSFLLSGAWARGKNEIATSVGLNQLGVMLKLEFVLLTVPF